MRRAVHAAAADSDNLPRDHAPPAFTVETKMLLDDNNFLDQQLAIGLQNLVKPLLARVQADAAAAKTAKEAAEKRTGAGKKKLAAADG